MKSVLVGLAYLTFPIVAQFTEANSTHASVASQIILPSTFTPPPNFKNINLVHIINLEKSYPREIINVVIENVANSTQDEYFIPFTPDQIKTIGALEVKDRDHLDKETLAVDVVQVENDQDVQYYGVKFPKPLPPKSQLTLGISFSYLSALTPKPHSIPQAGSQFLEYDFSAFAFSSYATLNQKTEIRFPNSNVQEYTVISNSNGNAEYPTKLGSKFTYGPFSDIQARASKPVKVRYQFTKALIHISKLERNIEISHWGGNIAFDEHYSLTNRAANLSELFNRVEWASTSFSNAPTTAIKDLKIPLNAGTLSPYYVDIIGNVSTSRFRSHKREASLEIKPRYPVFGGWNYPFRIGWDADSNLYLRKIENSRRYVLKVPFLEGPKQAEGVEYKQVEVRIILPEGAKNVKYSTTIPVKYVNTSLHKTYMDTIGRTTLSLTTINIFDDQRDQELIITYDYPPKAALRKPIILSTAFFCLFVATWIVGDLDTSIRAKTV